MISAWSSRQLLVLDQAKVAEKSNEITAIPELLNLLTLNGAIVTIDGMGCQKEIARPALPPVGAMAYRPLRVWSARTICLRR